MREPTFHVLAALADRPRYGYEVIQDVGERTRGRVTLKPGTLYAALDRLGDEGLISVDREEIVGGRLRRYYTLTDNGGAALRDEIARMREDAAEATARLGLSGGAARPKGAAT